MSLFRTNANKKDLFDDQILGALIPQHNETYREITADFVHAHKIIYIIHVNSLTNYAEFNQIFFENLGSHLQGPGGHVDQGLGGVHHVGVEVVHSIRCICFYLFFCY